MVDTFDIPPNYRFDLSTVPRPLWSIIAPFELGNLAPLIHDWIYCDAPRGAFTRKQADEIYLQIMLMEGIPPKRAKAAYYALRVGGWIWWHDLKGKFVAMLGIRK